MKCIIACSKPWCFKLVDRLQKEIDNTFILVDQKSQLTTELLSKIRPDYIFFPHWSHKIDEAVYGQYKSIIFHMTELPYGRGGSPLQNLIIRGYTETMLSAIQCVEELDAGGVYMQESLSLFGTADEIFLRASILIESMIKRILSERPKPIKQSGKITTFKRLKPEQGDWSNVDTLDEVFDKIRMLDADGYPPAFIMAGEYKIEFSRASRKIGSVIADVKISKVKNEKN